MQKQHTPHILFVGDTGVGKTTLIGSMSGHYLDPKATKPTIKSDFVAKQFTIGGSSNRMTLDAKLFDQQFEMRGSPPSIMRYKDVIVLVWSLTDMESYRNLGQNLKTLISIFDTAHNNPPDIILCANKCDLTQRDAEFTLCCDRYTQYKTIKISAVKGTGIQQLESVINEILLRRYNERSDQPLSDDTVSISEGNSDLPPRSEPNCC